MHKENKDENKRQESVSLPSEPANQVDELSNVWRELLGNRIHEAPSPDLSGNVPIPTLEVDPWSALLQAKGVEVVDLQHMHLRISDQEVEQMLQIMPDDPDCQHNSLLGVSEYAMPPGVTDADSHTG
jgi:hypothetical protein